MRILFSGITAVTLDGADGYVKNADVVVEDGRIAYVGPETTHREGFDRVISGTRKLLMPGLVNAHTHLPMVALRGYADDMNLQDWLFGKILPVEERFDPESIRIASSLALAEALSCGTTSVSDMYVLSDGVAEALAASGMKANIAKSLSASEPDGRGGTRVNTLADFAARWNGYDGGRLKVDAMIHAEYTTNASLWEGVRAARDELGLIVHVHVSETEREHRECLERYGKTPTGVFEEAGIFEGRVAAAHCVFLEQGDVDIFRLRDACVLHNPVSNLKLASGVAPVARYAAAGLRVALGTDGAASNNSLDMFGEMKTAALLQKGVERDPLLLPAGKVLEMAIGGGAFAQGREKENGSLSVGKDADLVMLNLDNPRLYPCHNPLSTAVYSATPADVELTMVRGRTLYEKGEFKTIDMERTLREMDCFVIPRLFGGK